MKELNDMSNLPTPIMRPSSFGFSTKPDADLHYDTFLPISDEEEAISHFLTEPTTMKVSHSNVMLSNGVENTNQDVSGTLVSHPQRVTPSQTRMNAPDKKRACETSSMSSIKPPDNKKTRGLECHVKNLSLIFEALSAT